MKTSDVPQQPKHEGDTCACPFCVLARQMRWLRQCEPERFRSWLELRAEELKEGDR